MAEIECRCGCGTVINDKDSRGREKRFVIGHSNKGKSNVWLRKSVIAKRTSHTRAADSKRGVPICEWGEIGGCKGRLDVAHIDGNPMNNDSRNILKLCRCHHRLLDNGHIDPKKPKMPPYVIRGGKRRYLHAYTALSRSEGCRIREEKKRLARAKA